MGVFKAMSVVCLVMLVLVLVQEVDGGPAKYIHYGAIGRDQNPGCSPKYPHNCVKEKANPYGRGCERETECRQGHTP
jgi:hypothetical protein